MNRDKVPVLALWGGPPGLGGTMKIVEQTGSSESHVWETGKAYWLPANAPNTMHADVNAGDQPIEAMVVELKKDK